MVAAKEFHRHHQRQPQGEARLSVRRAVRKQDRRRALRERCGGARRGRRAGRAGDGGRGQRAGRALSSPTKIPAPGWRSWRRLSLAPSPTTVAAVTGTKGKSSIVAFLREIWTALGKPAASLGTVGVVGPKGEMPLSHTTPDPVEIHRLLAQLKTDGVDHLAIEASSHGLDQYRLDGVVDRGRGLHQHHPRSYGLSPDLRGLPARPSCACSREVVAEGGVAVINADADHADALHRRRQKRAA